MRNKQSNNIFYDVVSCHTPARLAASVDAHHMVAWGNMVADEEGYHQVMRPHDTIIQIMPAVAGTTANYNDALGGVPFRMPVIGWGVTINGDVVAMDISDDGEIEPVNIYAKNFIGFTIPTAAGVAS